MKNEPKPSAKRRRIEDKKNQVPRARVAAESACEGEVYLPTFARQLLICERSKIKHNEKANPDLPTSVRLQLDHKLIEAEQIVYLYIEHAKFCMTDFMREHVERPHGSNNCIAVVVRAGTCSFIPHDQVYVRCFCADQQSAGSRRERSPADPIYKNGMSEMMQYEPVVRKLLETKFGADALVDAKMRRRIEKLYKRHEVHFRLPAISAHECNLLVWLTFVYTDRRTQSDYKRCWRIRST
jgi:hypothetical protein